MWSRLRATFASDSDYWRLLLFIFWVGVILASAFVVLAPRQAFSEGVVILGPQPAGSEVDYGPSVPRVIYAQAGSRLLEDWARDESWGVKYNQ